MSAEKIPTLEDAIRRVISERASAIAEEETAKITERVRKRLKDELGGIVASVAGYYDMQFDASRLIITVRKEP